MNQEEKKTWMKSLVAALLSALAVIAAAIGLNSCNVTRVVTNQSEYFQKGDTSVCITTKIIETYDATKR